MYPHHNNATTTTIETTTTLTKDKLDIDLATAEDDMSTDVEQVLLWNPVEVNISCWKPLSLAPTTEVHKREATKKRGAKTLTRLTEDSKRLRMQRVNLRVPASTERRGRAEQTLEVKSGDGYTCHSHSPQQPKELSPMEVPQINH